MVKAHPVAGKQKSIDLCNAFVQGAPKSAQGHVFYGVNSTNMAQWRGVKAKGADWFTIDNSYFDKTRGGMDLSKPGYFRVTKNRFQVDTFQHESDGKRFDALGIEVQPMRGFHGYCLAVEQSASFMADIGRDPDWLTDRIERTREVGTFEVRVRPWSAAKPDLGRSLPADLAGAAFVLTHSSAAAVEALLAGVHIQVSPMSAVHGVHASIRRHAFNVMADAQFTVDEIKNGKAWAWLNR